MLKPEQVPKKVIAAFREALRRDDTSFEDDFCAALNAWPGMLVIDRDDDEGLGAHIRLSLPTENPDAEA